MSAHKFPTSEIEPGLKEGAFYDPDQLHLPGRLSHLRARDRSRHRRRPTIVEWTAVDDFGTIINPMIVEGQVHGGIAQGVGQALYEHAVYDKDGQLMSGSFMDYAMPRAENFPTFQVGMTKTVCPSNPLGIKGCGEAGAIAAPAAVMNAITNAIGTEQIDMPATPAAVWRALQQIRAGARRLTFEMKETTMYAFKYRASDHGEAGGLRCSPTRTPSCWPAAIR